MNATIRHSRIWFAGLLGAAVLTGSPLAAQADDGKWWDPQQRGPAQERKQERRVERKTERRGDDKVVRTRGGGARRGDDRQVVRGRAGRGDDRQVVRGRAYRGERPRFQRQFVTIRDGHRGPSYRARRVWASPVFFHRQQLCVVRPVRYFVTAGVVIGGVRVNARFNDSDRYFYGCNFCDERFGSYRSYRTHVVGCDDRPHGYRFEVSDWDDEWTDEVCDDHGGYHDDHGDYYEDDYR